MTNRRRDGDWFGMRYSAVIFDLFGALVRSFTRQEYDQVNARMAKAVGIPFSDFWSLVAETGHGWYAGHYSSKEVCPNRSSPE